MKIDIDGLERDARRRAMTDGTACDYILALIARVREVEGVADEALVYWASVAPLDVGRIGELRERLEKGAVLP